MIVVSGSTGSIGTELVHLLRERGLPCRALTRDPQRARARFGPGIDVREADLARPETLDAALEGADAVFVLTAVADDLSVLEGNLVDAAARARARHIVKSSALGADLESPLTLGREHGRSEAHLRGAGVPFSVLRPGSFMQNLFMHAATIRTAGTLYAPYGRGRLPLIDARDVASAAASLLADPEGHEGAVYTLTGPEPISHGHVANVLGAVLGKPVTYVPIPSTAAREAMLGQGLPEWLVEDLLLMAERVADGQAERVTDDVERLTGRRARTIEAFARDHRAQFSD